MATDVFRLTALGLGLGAAAAGAPAWAADETEPPAAFEISSIRAHAFYPETGAFDDRDLTSGRLLLWNAPIGAGDLRAPTEVTLVLVELKGEFVPTRKGEIELRASVEGRELTREVVRLSDIWSSTTSAKVPFLVYGTGCGTLDLAALLTRDGKAYASGVASVGFNCGE